TEALHGHPSNAVWSEGVTATFVAPPPVRQPTNGAKNRQGPGRRHNGRAMAEFLIITGLSGAGRSQAADTFEDLGWFVVDNMPTALISKVMELVAAPGSETERVALVVGRAGNELDELSAALEQLAKRGARVRILYLEASDDVLVRRFENTRRRHPIEAESVIDAIAVERTVLEPVRERADVVIDTTDLNVHQ